MKHANNTLLIITVAVAVVSGSLVFIDIARGSADPPRRGVQISIGPHERIGWIEIEDSCLTLESDVGTEMALPMGRSLKTPFVAGTRLFIPKGRYEIANSSDSPIEYALTASSECRSQ